MLLHKSMEDIVRAWEEEIVIPTYKISQPEKNPMFLESRIYQGSSGVVYPHPVIEKIYDLKEDKAYKAVFIENEYLKIMILPELGGRVQMAFDKVQNRHFIYYNHVIKPALVGLTGPWISGGIEFNWPQHHRPSTFQRVEHFIESFSDGSKTVWCSEVERMSRTKGMVGFTLYPGKAYLQLKVRLYNRTTFPQTFLWWANPAIKVNDEYQSVFPPDVFAVFDHGKRDVSTFPIATGIYYKVDYSSGVDISRYKNIPVPTSYMANNSCYDFVGGYEHDTQAGMLHVADHHISPGKKQWTWGTGEFGKAWEKNLTDEDGPYIELMTGVFTDNQPDFSWIMPFEERYFEQYFMPYSKIGLVKNATKDAMLNLEIDNKTLLLKIYSTSQFNGAMVYLQAEGKTIFKKTIDISPCSPFETKIECKKSYKYSDMFVSLSSSNGELLVQWQPKIDTSDIIPEPAKPAKEPLEISNTEQLYLTGLHLEQYRHATYSPVDYYIEGLDREPGDIRCNNAMGLWLMRRGKFSDAEKFFRKAIETLTERNPNPYDGEPYYNLGCCLKYQGRNEEAFTMFYKSVWNAAWQDSGYFSLAQIATGSGKFDEAGKFVKNSLVRNYHNHKNRHLEASLLRIQGLYKQAMNFIEESLSLDRFNMGCLYEKYLVVRETSGVEESKLILSQIKDIFKESKHTKIEYALDYMAAGLFNDAREFIFSCMEDEDLKYPIVFYLLGYLDHLRGDDKSSISHYHKAMSLDPDYCFPNRIEEVLLLKDAIRANPEDSMAYYYLGNYWYANQQFDDALEVWEKSASINDTFPTVLRNLSLIWYNKKKEPSKAIELLEKAFNLNRKDSRILMELDKLYRRTCKNRDERLTILERYLPLVESRDDLYLERVILYNQKGDFFKAKELLMSYSLHPWEGGEGKVKAQYVICNLGMALKALGDRNYHLAANLLQEALNYPDNLGEGKLFGTLENNINYYLGCCYEGMGDKSNSLTYFKLASSGRLAPSNSFFYNDQPSDMIYYQGLALLKLGNISEAHMRFNSLIDYGLQNMNKKVRIDYFAVSLPDTLIWDEDLNCRNNINCNYLIGLGFLGKGETKKAIEHFMTVLSLDISHTETLFQLSLLGESKKN